MGGKVLFGLFPQEIIIKTEKLSQRNNIFFLAHQVKNVSENVVLTVIGFLNFLRIPKNNSFLGENNYFFFLI